MMLLDDKITRHLDFIIGFKKALVEELERSSDLTEAVEKLRYNGYKGEDSKAVQIIFQYALDSLMRMAIPIFLQRLLEEKDLNFLQELADTLTIHWADGMSTRGNDILVN